MNYSIISENYYFINAIDNIMCGLRTYIPGKKFSMAFIDMGSCRRVMDDFNANVYDLIVFLTEHENDYRLFPIIEKSCFTLHIVSSTPYNEFYDQLKYIMKHYSKFQTFPRSPRQMYDVITFTNIESTIIKLITDDKTPKSIASILDINVKAVYQHRSKIMGKLNVKSFVKMYGKLQQLEYYNRFLCTHDKKIL